MAVKTGDAAIAVLFKVFIDGQDIGFWNSFEGLGMETSIETREEGGNNAFVHQLPGRIKFTNVKLTRPINADSAQVAAWFSGMVKKVTHTTAQIVAVDTEDKVIAQWGLIGVVPVRWTGPSFNVENPKMALETLELAHHGFVDPAKASGYQGGTS